MGGLLRGATLLQASGNGVSPGLGKETTTPGSQSRDGADKGRRALAAPKAGRGQNGEEARPPQLPRAWGGGALSETPASPAPERGYGRRCQAVTSPGLRRKTRPPRPSRGRGQRKAGSSAAGPRNRFRLRRCSGTVTDPRGRHDGLLAAPQRGQAPPRPRPPMTSGARLAWGPGPSRHRFRRHCGVFRLWSPCPPRSGPVRPVKCGSPEGQGEW